MLSLSQGEVAGLVSRIGRRELQPRDGAVYLALLSFMNPFGCQVKVRVQVIAHRLGMQDKHVISSISRLCKAGYVYRSWNRSGEPVLTLLSPGGGPFPSSMADALC